MKRVFPYLTASLLAAFGLLTLFMSSSVIFDWFGIRAREGNYVLFVVWANFICGFIYLFSAYGLIAKRKWTVRLLVTATILLAVTLAGLFIYISKGGVYEMKTVGAMIFRISMTVFFAIAARFITNKQE